MTLLRKALVLLTWLISLIAALYVSSTIWFLSTWGSKHPLAWPMRAGWLATIIIVASLLVRRQLRRYRREKWTASGRCPVCGYDIRSSPTLCPECGKPIELSAISTRPSRAPVALKITIVVIVGALLILVSTPTEAGARLYLQVLRPTRIAIADAWYARPFSATLWREWAYKGAPFRGRHPRADMLADLLRSHLLVGESLITVESLLGPPDRHGFYDDTDVVYYLGQERSFLVKGRGAWLVFCFDQSGRVARVVVVGMDDPRKR